MACFANFYRRFIIGFSSIRSPLSALILPKVPFHWSNEAQNSSKTLKTRFTTAPILQIPEPDRQFIVEVDASGVGVGAILSQRSSTDQKIHPCAFFSRCLTPSERELLAVKLTLEEWRHWLEGTKVPFLVWTDHRNIKYIRSAKRLNCRQCRWSLFFGSTSPCPIDPVLVT